jgi:hypothetical protein
VPSPERSILLAPGPIARAAARVAREPEQRWMLCQPRDVRRSYVAGVVDCPDQPNAAEIWLLRQPDAVRASYVREVLQRAAAPS